jgi:hypothetical protein
VGLTDLACRNSEGMCRSAKPNISEILRFAQNDNHLAIIHVQALRTITCTIIHALAFRVLQAIRTPRE